MENGFTWVKGGGVVARGESNEIKFTHRLIVPYTRLCVLYLGWMEAALPPGPVVSLQGRIPSRHSWHQKTS